MSRIRSIKPEVWHSQSMGRVSRDARLCFIGLWTQADDDGRLRGSSRLLASLIFPYDDAGGLIDGWLDELEREGCIRRYRVDGDDYIDIPRWLKHQRIDHPSKSKFPEFREDTEKPREASRKLAPDQGREGNGRDQGRDQEIRARALAADAAPAVAKLDPVVEAWNEAADLAGLARVKSLTGTRRRAIKRAVAEHGFDGLREIFARVRASPFLRGERPSAGHEGWRADFDFVLKETNLTKILEGKYDDRPTELSAGSDYLSAGIRVVELRHGEGERSRDRGPIIDVAQPLLDATGIEGTPRAANE